MAYSTTDEFLDYCVARGYMVIKDPSVVLTLANDWIEAQVYKGEKTIPTQATEWPRAFVEIYGYEVASDEVPDAIKRGEMQMAMEIDKGNDPYEALKQEVIRKRVEGAVEIEYSDRASATRATTIRSVMPIIKNYLLSSGGLSVVRGY